MSTPHAPEPYGYGWASRALYRFQGVFREPFHDVAAPVVMIYTHVAREELEADMKGLWE
ncbi:hypothetical protein [Salinibacter ruber]|uniref:hypothetical protein n=1 Tax=Salinibacter ruber TaxID=146919 RepID=UPI0015E09B69|nr:hypothetical protein [Salinibacter ruber]MCS3675242.1 hypothetical protein [Salinibacter ruber]